MACGCVKRKAEVSAANALERTAEGDMIAMTTQPECTRRYSGRFQAALVYLVGQGTPHERIFTQAGRGQILATRHAKSHGLNAVRVPAKDLCHDAVLEVLGA